MKVLKLIYPYLILVIVIAGAVNAYTDNRAFASTVFTVLAITQLAFILLKSISYQKIDLPNRVESEPIRTGPSPTPDERIQELGRSGIEAENAIFTFTSDLINKLKSPPTDAEVKMCDEIDQAYEVKCFKDHFDYSKDNHGFFVDQTDTTANESNHNSNDFDN
jgi:hypothetical protein